jgi:hypothetical protein
LATCGWRRPKIAGFDRSLSLASAKKCAAFPYQEKKRHSSHTLRRVILFWKGMCVSRRPYTPKTLAAEWQCSPRHIRSDNASHSVLSMVSIISFLVFDLTIRQIVEDFRVRGAGNADH